MACRLLGAKALFEPMLTYSQLDHKEQNSLKYQSIFTQETAYENVFFQRCSNVGYNGRSFSSGIPVWVHFK